MFRANRYRYKTAVGEPLNGIRVWQFIVSMMDVPLLFFWLFHTADDESGHRTCLRLLNGHHLSRYSVERLHGRTYGLAVDAFVMSQLDQFLIPKGPQLDRKLHWTL